MIDWNALYKISLGLYILGAKDGNRPVGSIVDAVMVAANKPCALAISCNNNSYTKQCIEQSKRLSLSVLPKDVDAFVVANFGFQSSRDTNKWDKVSSIEHDNLPVLQDALAYITAEVVHQYPLESNTVFIAEIKSASIIKEGDNLLYEDYRRSFKDEVIKSFQQLIRRKTMDKQWVCTVCNYVYDGETPFEELPDDYVCPLCGVDKSFFEQRDA